MYSLCIEPHGRTTDIRSLNPKLHSVVKQCLSLNQHPNIRNPNACAHFAQVLSRKTYKACSTGAQKGKRSFKCHEAAKKREGCSVSICLRRKEFWKQTGNKWECHHQCFSEKERPLMIANLCCVGFVMGFTHTEVGDSCRTDAIILIIYGERGWIRKTR